MATSRKKTGSARNGYILPYDKLKQRELAFAAYRDLGPARSMHKLAELLKRDHADIAVTRPSLERWSRMHDWQARVKAHDKAMAQGRTQALAPPGRPGVVADPNFDQIDALLSAANQALTRAMSASPVVTKPSDVKALVDSAANALKLVETIKMNQVGKVSRQEVASEIERILGEVEKARRHDVELLVEAELKKRGIAIDGEAKVDGVVPVQVEAVPIDPDEPDVVDGEVEPAVEEPAVKKPGGMRLFTDVMKTFQG
jgi:hypothetical protein